MLRYYINVNIFLEINDTKYNIIEYGINLVNEIEMVRHVLFL